MAGPAYRGFLFSDLRGYTDFVERRGDAAAAELLRSYRDLVRTTVARHDGAEIKTEGDSFYVVFPSASAAVQCGLAIVAAAREYSASNPDIPINVGVGVHAGETVATAEGFVGSAVNVAARVCAQARAGEVLVTEPVRLLTRTSVPVTYLRRGTPRLKGISEPIAIHSAVPAGAAGIDRRRRQVVAGASGRAVGLVLAALVTAVLAALGGVVILGGGGEPAASPGPSLPLATGSNPTKPAASTPQAAARPLPCDPVTAGPHDMCQDNDLEPGRYRSTVFEHSVSFTLGPGWRMPFAEAESSIYLSRSDRPTSTLSISRVAEFSRLEPPASPDPDDPHACTTIRETNDHQVFVDLLRAQPWLEVGPEVPRRIAEDRFLAQRDVLIAGASGCGRQGEMVEFFIDHDGEVYYNLHGAKIRFLYPTESPIPYLIAIEAPTEQEFDSLLPIADEVILSLEWSD